MKMQLLNRKQFTALFLSLLFLAVFSLAALSQADPSATAIKTKTWAEKLGFPKGKTVLMLHMDDIGMCPEANAAAEH